MKLNELMVKELREEHRDREWVDKNGWHWMWCDGQWMYEYGDRNMDRSWRSTDSGTVDPKHGPFMEGLYYAATRGRR